MIKHTPGPWEARRRNVRDVWKVHVDDTNVVANVFGTTIKCDANSAEQQEANARLIAAAPELLAAVQHVLTASEDNGDMNDIDWAMLRAAIEKAEGKQ